MLDIKGTHDAKIVRVDGDFTKAQGLAEGYAHKNSAFLAGDYCYRKEGQKIIAYEAVLQLGNINSIIVPVGNATLISGIYKGLPGNAETQDNKEIAAHHCRAVHRFESSCKSL